VAPRRLDGQHDGVITARVGAVATSACWFGGDLAGGLVLLDVLGNADARLAELALAACSLALLSCCRAAAAFTAASLARLLSRYGNAEPATSRTVSALSAFCRAGICTVMALLDGQRRGRILLFGKVVATALRFLYHGGGRIYAAITRFAFMQTRRVRASLALKRAVRGCAARSAGSLLARRRRGALPLSQPFATARICAFCRTALRYRPLLHAARVRMSTYLQKQAALAASLLRRAQRVPCLRAEDHRHLSASCA